MSATIRTNADTNTLTLRVDGRRLKYSPDSDARVVECVDGKMFTATEQAAVELAGEIRAWGVTEARALGYAVVFWA